MLFASRLFGRSTSAASSEADKLEGTSEAVSPVTESCHDSVQTLKAAVSCPVIRDAGSSTEIQPMPTTDSRSIAVPDEEDARKVCLCSHTKQGGPVSFLEPLLQGQHATMGV